jgi:hypothetical protein
MMMFSFLINNNNNNINTATIMPLALTLIVMLVAAMPVILPLLFSGAKVGIEAAVHKIVITTTTTNNNETTTLPTAILGSITATIAVTIHTITGIIDAGVRTIIGTIAAVVQNITGIIAAGRRTIADAIGKMVNRFKRSVGNAALNTKIFALPTSETYLQLIIRAPRDVVLMATREIIVRATRAIIVRATRALVLFASRELVLRAARDLVIIGSRDLILRVSRDLVPFASPEDLIIRVCEEALAILITPVFAFVGNDVLNVPIFQASSFDESSMAWSPPVIPVYSFGMVMISALSSLVGIMVGLLKLAVKGALETIKTCVPVFADLVCILIWTLACLIFMMISLVKLSLKGALETIKTCVRVFANLIWALASSVCILSLALAMLMCIMIIPIQFTLKGMLEMIKTRARIFADSVVGKVEYYWIVVLPNRIRQFYLKVWFGYLGQGPQRTAPSSSDPNAKTRSMMGSYKRRIAKKQYAQKVKEMRERTGSSIHIKILVPGCDPWEYPIMPETNEAVLSHQ